MSESATEMNDLSHKLLDDETTTDSDTDGPVQSGKRIDFQQSRSRSFRQLLKKCLVEFLGTMLFVFIGCASIQSVYIIDRNEQLLTDTIEDGAPAISMPVGKMTDILTISLTHGLAIVALVSATANISGGMLNPAVSIAVWIADPKFRWFECIAYIIAQVGGGVAGTIALKGVYPDEVLEATEFGSHSLGELGLPNGETFTIFNGMFLEVILTMVLIMVVLWTAVDDDGLAFAPLPIGLAVAIDHLVGIPVTGASMNPARSFGPAVFAGFVKEHWIYWAGPALGAVISAAIYRFGTLLYRKNPTTQ
eukprot:m.13533 g.13533  ORF g.13533 m.13533 type:complete len:306 (-) comp5952_c0_seq1:444-1361(-)